MYRPSLILAASVCLWYSCASLAQDSAAVTVNDTQASASETPVSDVASKATEALAPDSVPSTISNDFSLPVTLDSKSQALDGKNKTSIFIDNVVIRQGSLELLADKVEVDAGNGTGKEIIIASGQPASYKQRKDDGSMVVAQANEITYQLESRTISLSGNALIMQNEVRVTGDLIVFDMTREQILASTNEDSNESVRTVISPGAFSIDPKDDKPTENKNQGQQ